MSLRLAWYKATDAHVLDYQAYYCTLLNDLNLPHAALLCRNVARFDTNHPSALNNITLIASLTHALKLRLHIFHVQKIELLVAIFPCGIISLYL